MKQTHAAALPHIMNAIAACGEDDRMSSVKGLLAQAAQACQEVGKKRMRRESSMERFVQEALAKDKLWWDTIKKNVALGMPERIIDDETGNGQPSQQ